MAGPMPPGPPPGPPPGQPPGPPGAPPPPPDQAPGDDSDPQGQSPAMKAVSMANDGLMQLGTIFEKSGGDVSPEEQKKLAGIINEFHQLIQSLSGDAQEATPPKGPAGGPMPAMAGRGSLPIDQG